MPRALRKGPRLGFAARWLKPRRSRERLPAFSAPATVGLRIETPIDGNRRFSQISKKSWQSPASPRPLTKQAPISTSAQSVDMAHPPEGSLAIVFTDIVESTQTWERLPEAMKQAMELHDDMLRSLTTHHHGYEVKQNGDGFMIAFQTAIGALEFCIDVQKKLMEIEWPDELLEVSAGSEVRRDKDNAGDHTNEEDILWRGLRLRMSVHFGEPICKWNEVISRMDYLGPIVNRAARFIQVTEGGQIIVSEEFLDELQKAKNGDSSVSQDRDGDKGPLFQAAEERSDSGGAKLDLRDLQSQDAEDVLTERQFEVRLLGRRHFKGLEEMQKLYFIIPYSLRGRLEYWPQHMHVAGSKGNLVG